MPEDGGELLEQIEVRFVRIEQRLDRVEYAVRSLELALEYATHRCHMNYPPVVPRPYRPASPYPDPGEPPGSGEDGEKTPLDYVEAWLAANHC
jgi:hypothetical protein